MRESIMKETKCVTGDMTINETIRERPATVAVFDRLGLDSCCGGALRIEEAAGRHGLALEVVLSELNAVALERQQA